MKQLMALFLCMSGSLMAQTEEVPVPPLDQSLWQTLVMIGIAFLFFYVILWRPEQKRRQALEAQRDQIKQGDRVAAMGILGTIVKITEKTVILRMVDGSKIEMYKEAVTDILPEEDGQKKEKIIPEELPKK